MSFRLAMCDTWRRILPKNAESAIMNEVRPHLIPVTKEAETFVSVDAGGFIGHSGLCPGEVLIDGQWVTAYRFLKLSEEDAANLILQLEAAIENVMNRDD